MLRDDGSGAGSSQNLLAHRDAAPAIGEAAIAPWLAFEDGERYA